MQTVTEKTDELNKNSKRRNKVQHLYSTASCLIGAVRHRQDWCSV